MWNPTRSGLQQGDKGCFNRTGESALIRHRQDDPASFGGRQVHCRYIGRSHTPVCGGPPAPLPPDEVDKTLHDHGLQCLLGPPGSCPH
jgi:hypothetical protein